MSGSVGRIWGLVYRHLALYRGSWPRLLELSYWPILQMCIWGFTSSYFAGRMSGSAAAMTVSALLGGVLLWEVTLRTQMGLSATFLEELWSRNLGHVFVSPLRPWEMMAALTVMSVLRMLAGVLPAVLLAWAIYRFDLFSLGAPLVLFVAALMLMGWCVGLGVMSLILRHGLGAEALAWSVTFGLAPFSCVFYPVSALPSVLRPVAFALPSSHVFEGLRAVMAQGVVRWDELGWAFGLDGIWLALAVLLFLRQFHSARVRGALLSIGE
ncbi:MAG: ABC transporter permease [Janthinobacterium lividum]